MDDRKKLQAIKARLGEPKEESPNKGEYGFFCPRNNCDSASHNKVRLWVNPKKDWFNCWHCGYSGRSLAPLMVANSAEQREYVGDRPLTHRKIKDDKPRCSTLPDGFTPFRLNGSRDEAPYLTYLKGRSVTEQIVALYRMGYVDSGQLAGRVVIPSFDDLGSVNFWSARSIHRVDNILRYRLPQSSKDVVSNEHMVDWKSPVYLVEGIFDEVAIGPQAISLYGKFMQSLLALRLVQNRPLTYICLDSGAWVESFDLVKVLLAYDVPCSLVNLDGKDPSSIGLSGVMECVRRSKHVDSQIGLIGSRI